MGEEEDFLGGTEAFSSQFMLLSFTELVISLDTCLLCARFVAYVHVFVLGLGRQQCRVSGQGPAGTCEAG